MSNGAAALENKPDWTMVKNSAKPSYMIIVSIWKQ
jgi:hypothetical protein